MGAQGFSLMSTRCHLIRRFSLVSISTRRSLTRLRLTDRDLDWEFGYQKAKPRGLDNSLTNQKLMANILCSRYIYAPDSVIAANSNNVCALLPSTMTSAKMMTRSPDYPQAQVNAVVASNQRNQTHRNLKKKATWPPGPQPRRQQSPKQSPLHCAPSQGRPTSCIQRHE